MQAEEKQTEDIPCKEVVIPFTKLVLPGREDNFATSSSSSLALAEHYHQSCLGSYPCKGGVVPGGVLPTKSRIIAPSTSSPSKNGNGVLNIRGPGNLRTSAAAGVRSSSVVNDILSDDFEIACVNERMSEIKSSSCCSVDYKRMKQKERNLVKLAKELHRRTSDGQAKDARIEQLEQDNAKLREELERVKDEYEREMTDAKESCVREYSAEIDELRRQHEETRAMFKEQLDRDREQYRNDLDGMKRDSELQRRSELERERKQHQEVRADLELRLERAKEERENQLNSAKETCQSRHRAELNQLQQEHHETRVELQSQLSQARKEIDRLRSELLVSAAEKIEEKAQRQHKQQSALFQGTDDDETTREIVHKAAAAADKIVNNNKIVKHTTAPSWQWFLWGDTRWMETSFDG